MEGKIEQSKTSKIFLTIYFLLLAVVFNPLTFKGKNIVFIAAAIICILVLLTANRRFPLTLDKTFFPLLALLVISFAINIKTADVLSFVYSVFFLIVYFINASFAKSRLSKLTFNTIAFAVLATYMAMLLIGQLYVLLGFFQGPFPSMGLTHGPFGTLWEADRGYRFYSFSTEPSYAAFIVIASLYAFMKTSDDSKFGLKKLLAWLMSIYMIISFQSGYGIILLVLLILFLLNRKNFLIAGAFFVIILIVAVLAKEPAAMRVFTLITNLQLSNLVSIANIDYSASFRVLPTYYYINNFNFTDIHYYLGHGAGQSDIFLGNVLFEESTQEIEGGFLPQFLYDYGIFFGICFIIFLFREVITKFISFDFFIVLLMMTNANLNTQLFWFVILMLSLTRHYISISKTSSETSNLQLAAE